jgi:hypothetical protein
MLDGRHLAIAGLVVFALGAGATAAGCANGTPVDDAVTIDDLDAAVPETSVPQGDSGTTPPAVDGGCKQKSDCPDGLVCDTGSGLCVGCNGDGDCPPGKLCDANTKTCAAGCNANHPCDTGKTCCNNTCAATSSVTACTGCGLACDTAHSTGPSCDGKTCAYTGCSAGFGDCKTAAPDLDGCETPVNTITDCGGCGRGCSTTNVAGAPTCANGACNSACSPGFGNCSLPAAGPDGGIAPDDGCESNLTTCAGTPCCGVLCGKHDDGIGSTYVDCADPLGTPGNAATYNLNMANLVVKTFAGGNKTILGNCFNQYSCAAEENTATGECYVWCYTGQAAGYLAHSTDGSCACPADTTYPKWN